MTAHIAGSSEDFASTVIMPGDPLRAKYIAETYLDDAKLVTDIRNMLGYTGYYKGQRISVMGHGMGIPSMVLYGHELINDFGVKRIIRIGSIGATQKDVHMRDVILAQAAGTDLRRTLSAAVVTTWQHLQRLNCYTMLTCLRKRRALMSKWVTFSLVIFTTIRMKT